MDEDLEMGMFSQENVQLNIDGDISGLDEYLNEDNTDEDVDTDSTDDSSEKDINDGNIDHDGEEDDEDSGDSSQSEDLDDEGDDSEQDATSPNLYSSFAAVLTEKGLLPSLNLEDSKIEDIDSLTEAFKVEINNQARQRLIETIGEEGVEALDKGVSLLEYQQHQNNIQTLESVTDEVLENDIELSKNIILQDYISQGISEARALRILEKTIDLGEDAILEDAKLSLTSLKELQSIQLEKVKEERAAELARQNAQQEKIDNDLKNSIYREKEIIEGIKLDKNIQDKVYNSITKIVGTSPNGVAENKLMRERRENPIEFDTKLYYLYELTNGFKDFSKLITKSKSKAASDLENSLRQTSFKNEGNKPTFMADPESYGGIGSEIVI